MSTLIPGTDPPLHQAPNEAYSASKHAVQGVGENVQEAKDTVSKATNSIKDLVSGKGNMVDAAMAVKDAYDNVTGLTGRLSATAMMPVMKALSAFKGQAILPAGKQMDPVMGIDVHMVTIPPSPAPVPMPHPYIGILFNTKDWVSCLINTFKKDALDALPEPAEGDKSNMASIAKNKDAIASIAMGLAGMSASVKFGGFVPRAVTGTKVKSIPHIPMGAGFHPAFAASVAKNNGKAFLGSLFVAADGDPMVGSFHLNYDCWDVGVVDLFKGQRAGAKKAPEAGAPLAELFVPSGTVLPIPWGRPVLVNSIPTPINPMAILDKLFKAGLGKLKAAGRKLAQKGLDKLNGKVGCGPLTAASKLIGTGQSHPVDVSSGHFYTDNIDFSLPGPIPLSFERTWYSYSSYDGPLGHGWHHSYDMALAIDNETQSAILRMSDGRVANFEIPATDKAVYNRSEKLTAYRHGDGYYYVTDKNGLIYQFTEKVIKNSFNGTETHLLQSITNLNGFAIKFKYNHNALLSQITDSSGRVLKVNNDSHGRIINIEVPDPRFQGRLTFPITSYIYTDEGDMAQQTDALNQAELFEYRNHLMLKEVWRNGLTWNFRYNKVAGIDVKCIEVWGDKNLLHYKFDYSDPHCTIVINSLGYTKTFCHKNGVVIKYIDPKGAIWKYQYNEYQELKWETDPLGNQDSYTHDERGNITTTIDPGGGFDQTEYSKVGFTWLPTMAIDKAGGKWKWDYDRQGNLLETISPLNVKTKYNYKNGLLDEIINADGSIASLNYDGDHNLIYIRTDNGATTQYKYDILGNCIEVINPCNSRKKRNFDLLGRIIQSLDFDGNTIYLEYDEMDNVVHYKDKHTDILYTYGGLWKLLSVKEGGATIHFSYDTEEQLRKVINEQGLPYTFKWDEAGNMVEETSFDNITRCYEYNLAGWITQINRPSKKFTRYEYDPCGRTTEVQYSDNSKEIYSYRADGELIKAGNDSAIIQFERDVFGKILKENVNGEWIASEYDICSARIKTTSSLGATILHKYNKMGDLTQLQANDWLAKIEHDVLGMEIERSLPGNVISHWQRNGIGDPVSHLVTQATNKTFQRKRDKQYLWEVDDRLKQVKDDRGITRFEYDVRSNLSKTIFSNGEVQYRNPDAVGNLFKSENRSDRIYTNGGKLKKSSGWDYNYDSEGNLIEKRHTNGNIWIYEWNHAGLLTKVIKPDKTAVSFGYDALERRIYKKYKNTITKFVWDGDVPLHEWKEHAVTGEKLSNLQIGQNGIVTWIFDSERLIPAAKLKGDKSYSIITDHLGTPCQMYKDDGELFWECELDSYGKIRMEEGERNSCPFRYQGQYEDIETGLCYNRFRYYAPEEGLYLSHDPIGLSGQLALYGYVPDTNIWIDPFGLKTCKRQKAGEILKGWKGPVDYSSIKDPKGRGPRKNFTTAQKAKIYALNKARNGGYIVSDKDGTILKPSKKSESGAKKPSKYEAQVDHKNPKDNNGTNSNRNAAVLSREQNRSKSSKR